MSQRGGKPGRIGRLAILLSVGLPLCGCGGTTGEGRLARYDPYAERSECSRDFAEVDLGEFLVTFPDLETGVSRLLMVHVVGVVPAAKQGEFKEAYRGRQQRMRARLREVLQRFDVLDATAGTVELLKTDVAQAARQSLRTDNLKEVVFTDFTVE